MTNKVSREAEFDKYRDTYSTQINQSLAFSGKSHDFFTKVKANYLVKILRAESFLHQTTRVLDVGCGHGLIHPFLLAQKDIKLEIFGVDVASSVIDFARAANPIVSYQAYDGITLPYVDNTFDLTFAICVMHHVPTRQWCDFLQEMQRVLKPGGVAVIFEHNPLNPITRKIVKNCPLDRGAVLINSKSMEKMLQRVGFIRVNSSFILFTPIDKPFFLSLDHMLGWLPFGAQYYTLAKKPLSTLTDSGSI